MDFKKILSDAKSTPSTAKKAVKIDSNVYVSIKQIAVILDRSIYRTRQLGWDGHFGTVHQPEKEVYYRKDAVLAYKLIQDARGLKNNELDGTRTGKRVTSACQLISLILNQDVEISLEVKRQFLTILAKYDKQAQEMIESDK